MKTEQIKKLKYVLDKVKDNLLQDITRINNLITRKKMIIEKMKSYRNEYEMDNYLVLSRSIPSLNNNIQAFSGKIEAAILQTENEIESLNQKCAKALNDLNETEKKLKAIEIFQNKLIKKEMMAEENSAQIIADDSAMSKLIKGVT